MEKVPDSVAMSATSRVLMGGRGSTRVNASTRASGPKMHPANLRWRIKQVMFTIEVGEGSSYPNVRSLGVACTICVSRPELDDTSAVSPLANAAETSRRVRYCPAPVTIASRVSAFKACTFKTRLHRLCNEARDFKEISRLLGSLTFSGHLHTPSASSDRGDEQCISNYVEI